MNFLQRVLCCHSALLFSMLMSSNHAIANPVRRQQKCVRILYDQSSDSTFTSGRIYAIFLQNLLGHFEEIKQIVQPIESYQKGDIQRCEVNFYLGAYYNNPIPPAFLQDITQTKRTVVWIGYNLWQLPSNDLDTLFGYRFDGLTGVDTQHLDPQGSPTFFKNILYKGETFFKYGAFDNPADSTQFSGSFDQLLLSKTSERGTQVLSEAVHNFSDQHIPYILRNQNRYIVADMPFSYIDEADRYLIFSDLLFDILDAEPRFPKAKPAVVRVEDFGTANDPAKTKILFDLLKSLNVPYQVNIIPIFADPFNSTGILPTGTDNLPIWQDKHTMGFIDSLKASHVAFVQEGVSHQYDHQINPTNGVSGSDCEFWNCVNQTPLAEDSVDYVLNRLNLGWDSLTHAGISTSLWVTPKYKASLLDNYVFAAVYPWSTGRFNYYTVHKVKGIPKHPKSKLWMEVSGTAGLEARRKALGKIKIIDQTAKPVGQFFPYEIYGDVYGQRILPEDLGYLSANPPITSEDILTHARRNQVLRDVWASVYIHVDQAGNLRATAGGRDRPMSSSDITNLIQGIAQMNYKFIDIRDFTLANKDVFRKRSQTPDRKDDPDDADDPNDPDLPEHG